MSLDLYLESFYSFLIRNVKIISKFFRGLKCRKPSDALSSVILLANIEIFCNKNLRNIFVLN